MFEISPRFQVTLAALVGMIVGIAALAEAACKAVTGTFHEDAVSVNSAFHPPCKAKTNGLCTTGPITGDLQGTYSFALTGDNEAAGGAAGMENPALVRTFAPFPSTVIHFTGRDVIETEDGNLFGAEAGALDTASPGNYGDLMTITGGTRVFVSVQAVSGGKQRGAR